MGTKQKAVINLNLRVRSEGSVWIEFVEFVGRDCEVGHFIPGSRCQVDTLSSKCTQIFHMLCYSKGELCFILLYTFLNIL